MFHCLSTSSPQCSRQECPVNSKEANSQHISPFFSRRNHSQNKRHPLAMEVHHSAVILPAVWPDLDTGHQPDPDTGQGFTLTTVTASLSRDSPKTTMWRTSLIWLCSKTARTATGSTADSRADSVRQCNNCTWNEATRKVWSVPQNSLQHTKRCLHPSH